VARLEEAQKQALADTRRHQIVTAAIELWLEDGFDAVSVEAIARRAGLAKGTVYLYFRTKEEILGAAIERHSLVPDLAGFLAGFGDRPLTESLPALVRNMWQSLRARAPVAQLLLRELLVRPAQARQFLEQVVVPANRLLAEYLEPAAECGALRRVDRFIAMRTLAGALMSFVVTQELFGGAEVCPLDAEELTRTISDLFLHGLLRKGG
jgi:AcrR family transcriptional regulator